MPRPSKTATSKATLLQTILFAAMELWKLEGGLGPVSGSSTEDHSTGVVSSSRRKRRGKGGRPPGRPRKNAVAPAAPADQAVDADQVRKENNRKRAAANRKKAKAAKASATKPVKKTAKSKSRKKASPAAAAPAPPLQIAPTPPPAPVAG